MEDPGQYAYEAYQRWAHGVSPITGEALPPWSELDQSKRDAWNALID